MILELSDFILNGIKERYILDLRFILGLFSYITKDYEDDFYKIEGKSYYVKLNDDYILITDDYSKPITTFTEEITIDDTLFNIPTKTLKTTVGRAILNALYNKYCFNNKIPYINEQFTIKTLESKIEAIGVVDDEDANKEKDKITMSEYIKFNDMTLYQDTFANFLSLGVTEHSIKEAPGMEKFIEKTIKELEDKYKEKPLNNPKAIAELEKAIIDYDVEYLKEDPSYNKIITKKVVNISRKRMYGIYGITTDVTGKQTPVMRALIKGLNKDVDTISAMFNDLIVGVAGRGDETKDAGVTTKEMTRAISSVIISDKFCGSKLPIEEVISSDNYIGRYISIDNKPYLLTRENIDKYMNKKVLLYDILTCKSDTGACLTCSGLKFKGYEKGLSLLSISLGGMLLNNKLKKFHSSELKIVKIDENDIV